MDKDGNGKLTLLEFQEPKVGKVKRELAEVEKKTSEKFKEIDVNKDGAVSRKEYDRYKRAVWKKKVEAQKKKAELKKKKELEKKKKAVAKKKKASKKKKKTPPKK